jgi:hypothetical protein
MQSRTYLHDLLVSTLFTEGLDSDMDLWALGFTALWVKGADLDTLARTFGMDLATRTPCHLSEILDHAIDDGSRWVGEANGWIGIVPAQADREVVRSVAEGGRGPRLQHGHQLQRLLHLRPRRAHDRLLRPSSPAERYGDDPHALDHLMDGLRFQIITESDNPDDLVEIDESISSALALIGRITETAATDAEDERHLRAGHRHPAPRNPGPDPDPP